MIEPDWKPCRRKMVGWNRTKPATRESEIHDFGYGAVARAR